eukprot:533799-Alexandrium_andersonii.AAC.1
MEPWALHGHFRADGRVLRGEEAYTNALGALGYLAVVLLKEAGVPYRLRNLGHVVGRRVAVVVVA